MKNKICEVFDEFLFSEGMSYEQIMDATKLTKSQIHLIRHRNGAGVSLDRMIEALEFMGVELYLEARLWIEPDPELLDQECPE